MRIFKILVSFYFVYLLGVANSFGQLLMHYTSERFEYSVMIPEQWNRNDQLKSEKLALVLVSPEHAFISITFYSLKGAGEEEFIDQYRQNLESQLTGISIQEKGMFKSRDDETTYLLLDYDKTGVRYREKHSFFRRKNEIAVLVAGQEKEKFHEILPIIERVFSSFTFETKQEKVDNLD